MSNTVFGTSLVHRAYCNYDIDVCCRYYCSSLFSAVRYFRITRLHCRAALYVFFKFKVKKSMTYFSYIINLWAACKIVFSSETPNSGQNGHKDEGDVASRLIIVMELEPIQFHFLGAQIKSFGTPMQRSMSVTLFITTSGDGPHLSMISDTHNDCCLFENWKYNDYRKYW